MQEHNHEHGEDVKESPEQLMLWLEHFAKTYKAAASRKARCEDLMRRKKSKKWSPEKTKQMVRRLMTANTELEKAEGALDQVTHKLSQLGVEVSIMPKSRALGMSRPE